MFKRKKKKEAEQTPEIEETMEVSEGSAAGEEAVSEQPDVEAAEEEVAELEESPAAPVVKRPKPHPTNNVYSVMVLVAFLSLATLVGVVWAMNLKLTEGERPADLGFHAAPFFIIKK